MKILKRATPWMITLVILLGLYVASFFWYHKPRIMMCGLLSGTTLSSTDELLIHFYKPMWKWEEEQIKQKSRKALLSQCQGEWQGTVRPPSGSLTNHNQPIEVEATIKGDQFKITRAESMPELVGATWKMGSEMDVYPRCGIFTNNYPAISSIFLSFITTSSGQETLKQILVIQWSDGGLNIEQDSDIELVRPAARVSAPSNN